MNEWYVVCGASSGIGRSIAEKLLETGKSVIATSRNEQRLVELFGQNRNVNILPWDLSNLDTIDEYTQKVKASVGPIKGLIYCAGYDKMLPVHMNKPSDIIKLMAIHTIAPIRLIALFSKQDCYAEGSSFVLLSSMAAHQGSPGHSAYAAAKGAIEGFVPTASAELIYKGIRINAIIPRIVETPMSNGWLKRLSEEQLVSLKEKYPLGFLRAEDVANVALFLLSDKASKITGQKLFI